MFVSDKQRLQLSNAVVQDLAEIDHTDAGYVAKAIEIIQSKLDAFEKEAPLPPLVSAKLAAQVAGSVVGTLQFMKGEQAALEAQKAATMLSQTAAIREREELILGRFGVVPPHAEPPPVPKGFAQTLSAYSGLAGTLGAKVSHDSYVRYEQANTVLGDRANEVGQYRKRSRTFMLPFDVILDKAKDPADGLLQTVIRLNKDGITDTLLGLADAENGPLTEVDGYVEHARALPDHFSGELPNFDMSVETERYLYRVGAELKELYEAAEHDPTTVPWEDYPTATAALASAHDRWVQRNSERADDADKVPFAHCDPRTKARNIPVLLATIDGILRARDAIQDIMLKGVIRKGGAISEAGFGLQMHLVASARSAHGENNPLTRRHADAMTASLKTDVDAQAMFHRANQIHARAVADESAVLMMHGAGIHDMSVLAKCHQILTKACTAAGEEFLPDGRGADGAAPVALEHMGELLSALHSEMPNLSREGAQEYAIDLLRRATIDDLADLMPEGFHRAGVEERGDELIAALKDITPESDYFYEQIDSLPIRDEGSKPLNEVERRDLGAMLRLVNATWKAGQVHRVRNDKGEMDWSRADPAQREAVYNPYDLLVTGAGQEHKALFMVVKDLVEVQKYVPER